MAGINDLVNNIRDSVTGFLDQVRGVNDEGRGLYPLDYKGTLAADLNLGRANWNKLVFPYTFSVIDINSPGSIVNSFSDFQLPLAPQSITQDEEFAISIKPTQGGTVTTHSGNKYKTLNIQGTTGIAPFRGSGGVDRKTGQGIFQPNQLKYASGYEVFIALRNYFRTYYEFKKDRGPDASGLRLVFKNYKDGEFLIIEVIKFTMDRQAAKPMMYDYKIEAKVLAHFDFTSPATENNIFNQIDNILDDANRVLDISRGVLLRGQDILRQIESTYQDVILEPLRKISLILKAARALPTVAADIAQRNLRATMRELDTIAVLTGIREQQQENRTTGNLDPRLANAPIPKDLSAAAQRSNTALIDDLREGLVALDVGSFPAATQQSILDEQEELQNTPRSFFENALSEIDRVKANAEDFFGLGSPEFDAIFDRTATLSADETKVITAEEYEILNALNSSKKVIQQILSTDQLFKSGFDERIADIIDRFDNRIDLIASTAVKQIELPAGTTLERIALRELGDSSRWGEIVELNNLQTPYITDDLTSTKSNVLKPGDKLLIPTQPRFGFSQAPAGAENKLTKNLSERERALGVDFKLNPDFDLIISNAGDLELIAGAQNMAQAVVLKLSYEKGDVVRHPSLGANVTPGQKFPPLQEIKDDIIRTLLQDARVERVDDLALIQENSELSIRFNLQIKQVDLPVPIKIVV